MEVLLALGRVYGSILGFITFSLLAGKVIAWGVKGWPWGRVDKLFWCLLGLAVIGNISAVSLSALKIFPVGCAFLGVGVLHLFPCGMVTARLCHWLPQ